MLFAKLSTDKTIVFGPVLDSTGAAKTDEVVASIKIMKNGASAAALDAAATLTHSATGVYLLLLKAADISAVGEVTVVLNSGTNSASAVRLNVLPATVYDALVTNAVNATGGLVGATAAITTMAGVIATATNITAITGNITGNLSGSVGSVTGAVTVGTINPDVVNASALAADAVAEIQSGLALAATALSTTQWTNTLATNIGTTNTTVAANLDTTISGRMATYTQPTGFLAATFPATVASTTNITAATGITVSSIGANVVNASALAADAVAEIQSGLATAANLLIVSDGVGFITSVLLGTISDAGTAGETYVITFGGATYTLDYTGLDATGNRTGVTRTKV